MQPPQRRTWLLVVFCVALSSLFGFVCALDEDGDFSADPWLAERNYCAPDELPGALPAGDGAHWLRAVHAASPVLTTSGLRAAVPGGLCLLS